MKNIFLSFVFLSSGFLTPLAVSKNKVSEASLKPGVQAPQKKQKAKRRLARKAASEKRFVSKEDILGAGYNKDLDSAPIHAGLNTHLNAIESLCHMQAPLSKKIQIMEKNLQKLRAFLIRYLREPYLSDEDNNLLGEIQDAVERKRISMGKPLTEAFNEIDIEFQFTMAYRLNYNLPESTSVSQYPSWAKKIHRGLSCLYPKDKRNPASRKASSKPPGALAKKSPSTKTKKTSP